MTNTERQRRHRANKRRAEIAAGLRPARKKKPMTATQRWRRWYRKTKAARSAQELRQQEAEQTQ
jgi:hypothetical protein